MRYAEAQWPRFISKVSAHSTLHKRKLNSDALLHGTAAPPTNLDRSVLDGPLGIARLALDDESIDAINKSTRRAARKSSAKLTHYPTVEGERYLRDALAVHFSNKGFTLSANELVITHGCMDAVKTALTVCTKPGDTVAVSSPCFSGLLDLLANFTLNIIEIPTLNNGLDLNQFEALLKQGKIDAGLFCCTHMNPQGITLPINQKKRLAELATRYQIPIIEDDVYLELGHQQLMPLPTNFYDESGYMLWCGSISKTLSPSYRLGWCKPGRYYHAYKRHASSVPTLTQLMLADFIGTGAYSKHLKRAKQQLSNNSKAYHAYLAKHLPAACAITQPNGGLVLWIKTPVRVTQTMQKKALELNLDLRWGRQFTLSKRYMDCIRINIGFPLDNHVQIQLDILINLIRSELAAKLDG